MIYYNTPDLSDTVTEINNTFCFKSVKNNAVHGRMTVLCVDKCMSCREVYKQIKRFKGGQMNAIYDTCFWLPSTVKYIGVKFRTKIIFRTMKELTKFHKPRRKWCKNILRPN
jgi:hypothetical protein